MGLIDWLTRRLWYWMLRLMRTRWIRRWQRGAIPFVSEDRRTRIRRNIARQNLWALRHGRGIVRFTIQIVALSLIFRIALEIVWALQGAGMMPTGEP